MILLTLYSINGVGLAGFKKTPNVFYYTERIACIFFADTLMPTELPTP